MNGNCKSIPDMLRDCIDDAMKRVDRHADEVWGERELAIYSWPQQWGTTTCGFGGIGGQAFTTAQTFVIQSPSGDVLVYHAGRFARHVHKPTEAFWEQFGKGRLPGLKDADWGKFDAAQCETKASP
jgi:hypothetical protein